MSYEQDDLLFTNTFIKNDELTDLSEDHATGFRSYYEKSLDVSNREELNKRLKNRENINIDKITDLDDLKGTNPFDLIKTENIKPIPKSKNVRIQKERKTIVSIDSRDRNKEKYPKVNKFSAFLGKTFKNVKSIRLISTEFPNTEGVIKENINDKIYWRNQEDEDLGFPVYSIAIRPGSYTALSLTNEIVSKLNSVKRRNGVGQYHYFQVNIDLDTDIVTINSFIIKDLPNNPISTSEGTGIITVTSLNHGFTDGELVEIIGVKRTAGIPTNIINGSFNITFINTNQFSYEVNVNAIESISGGGNVVKTGKQAPMQLLWNSYTDVIGPLNLGYLNENSSEPLNDPVVENPLLTKTLNINDVTAGDPVVLNIPNHGLSTSTNLQIINISADNPTTITTLDDHNLNTGDIVFITDTDSIPSINDSQSYTVTVLGNKTFTIPIGITSPGTTGILKIGGEKIKVFNLITNPPLNESHPNNTFLAETHLADPLNKIEINALANTIDPSSIIDAYIGTSQVYVTHNNHGFNQITNIDNNGSGIVKVTTQLNHGLIGDLLSISSIDNSVSINTVDITVISHGLTTGDYVNISNTDSTPIINGDYYITKLTDDIFSISLIGGVSVSGTSGIVKNGNSVTISNSNSVPSIDGSYHRVVKVSDTEFNVYNNDPNNVFPSGLSSTGDTGILGIENKISLYRTSGPIEDSTDIAGIRLSSINGTPYYLDSIIDENTYLIKIPDNYADTTIYGGGSDIRVNSEKHGMDFKQTNTSDGTHLNRSVSLEGENYVFLVCPGLGTITSSSGLENIFAKILLSEPPNTLMFNTFLSNSKIYEDAPLSTLNDLTFEIKNNDGTSYNFNDIDYSFSLEIVEYIDILQDSSLSSRRGIKDFSSTYGESNIYNRLEQETTYGDVLKKQNNRLNDE